MLNFCSYFDKNYLSKFLVLRDSLLNLGCIHNFYVLALDDFTYQFLNKNNFNNTIICHVKELEKRYRELKKIKSNGNYEYGFLMEYNIPYINNGDEDLKKTIKKENSGGNYGNYFNLNNDNEINEAISTLNILKKNNKLLRTFKYKIKDYKNKKSILGLGIKKNKKNNNSYLSLLKSMI